MCLNLCCCPLAHRLPARPRLWDARTGKCTAVTNAPGIWVTWCPDGSSYAVVNSDNTFSICDMRKAGKVVKQHKFATQVRGELGCPRVAGWSSMRLQG